MGRKVLLLIGILSVLVCLCPQALAETHASTVQTYMTVTQDGNCQVTQTVTLQLAQAEKELRFPIPVNATNVTMNGVRPRIVTTETARLVELSDSLGGLIGSFSMTVQYTLSNCVESQQEQLLLRLPLLSGFAYPVKEMEFSVTLPDSISGKPAFSSGYHHANIEKDLTYIVQGATLTGRALKALKDHETLEMTLQVTEELFPQDVFVLPDFDALKVAMTLCGILALIYWLIFLRCSPFRASRQAIPPEGCTAGEMGAVLHLQGGDLTGMILSWAQLGYLLIHLDRNGRVSLHRRMDMGNERGNYEQRVFKKLFGTRNQVQTASPRFAELWRKTEKQTPGLQAYVQQRSGNPNIFRGIAAAMGACGGAAIGIALSADAALQVLLVALLAILGIWSSWMIQRWAYRLFLRDRWPLWMALGLSVGWLALSGLSRMLPMGILVVLCQLLAGLMAAFGGRRTEYGRQTATQILGLRKYLRSVSRQELQRISAMDPDYYHNLAPYALALGTDRRFARLFGKYRMPPCPYLTTGKDQELTAEGWSKLLRRMVTVMETGVRMGWTEKLRELLNLGK